MLRSSLAFACMPSRDDSAVDCSLTPPSKSLNVGDQPGHFVVVATSRGRRLRLLARCAPSLVRVQICSALNMNAQTLRLVGHLMAVFVGLCWVLIVLLLLRHEHAGTSARGGMPAKEGPKTVDHTTTASLTARGRRRSARADKAKSARAAHDEG